MSLSEKSEIIDFEEEINKKIPISKRWKEYIVNEFKKQANEIEELEELPTLLRRWRWFRKPQPWVWETINMLDLFPATTAYLLAVNYIFEKGMESQEFGKKSEKKLAQRFRRALYRLHTIGIITPIYIQPDEVGPGRRSVTIWTSPFVKGKDIDKVKVFYLSMGGILGQEVKEQKKTPKEVVEHNLKVQAYHTLYKYTVKPKLYNFYKCPKKHVDGLKRIKKYPYRYRKQKPVNKCPKCNKILNEIHYEDFIVLKEKALLNPSKDKV